MSDNLKNLFKTQGDLTNLGNKSVAEIADEANSKTDKYVDARTIENDRFIPHIDFSSASNFVKFGSAERYYDDAITRIVEFYPYDGSSVEKLKWHNSSSYLDLHIFDNEYPRTNGYVTFASGGYAVDAPGNPSTKEYIVFYGGPNTASAGMAGKPLVNTFSGSNIWDTGSLRESNLKFDLTGSGATVEFWVKLGELDPDTTTQRQVIFDLANNEASSSDGYTPYGRFQLYYYNDRDASNSGLNALIQSGSISQQTKLYTIDDGLELTSTGSWNHYAVTLVSTGSSLVYEVYQNGIWVNRVEEATPDSQSAVSEITGALQASIGAGVDSYYVTPGSATGGLGWWKLSGSVDEFRYWKTKRTSRQIGLNWLDQVEGGVNTDDATNKLGVYYKFNEGITTSAATDRKILDYSGRITNGVFVGYTSGARSTGSAIVEASASAFEFKDPILYRSHPEVSTLTNNLKLSGTLYDYNNVSSLYSSVPSWIQEEDDDGTLKNLTQIMSSYLDTVYLQIDALPTFGDNDTYTSASSKPYPFAQEMLESAGFIAPELFVDADILEALGSRSDTELFTEDINNVKNRIYENIYNNLINIYKSKGTHDSFRNLIHCFGVDEDVVDLKMYGNNIETELQDNLKNKTFRKNYVNFHTADNFSATCYQQTGSGGPTLATEELIVTGNPAAAGTIIITDTAGTEVTFVAAAAEAQYKASPEFIRTGAVADIATSIAVCVNQAFTGTIVATAAGTAGTCQLTQSVIGSAASMNRAIGGDATNLTSDAFTGGAESTSGGVNSAPYIGSSTNLSNGFGMTFEAEVVLPDLYDASAGPPYVGDPFASASLFGIHTPNENRTVTQKSPYDPANFQVYAVKEYTQGDASLSEVKFVLTSSNPDPSTEGWISELTSAAFPEAYKNKRWNFAVKVAPDSYPAACMVTESCLNDYKVEFYGVSTEYNVIQHEFYLTTSLTPAQGQTFLSSSKRVYAGAHRFDFTGSTLQRSDARISSVRAWLDVLSNDEVLAHAKDPTTFGRMHPYRQAFLTGSVGVNAIQNYIPRIETRILDWDFALVNSASAEGQFDAIDNSSGSLFASSGSGWLGPILHLQHPGLDMGF